MAAGYAITQVRSAEEIAAFGRLNWAYRDVLLAGEAAMARAAAAIYTPERYRAALATRHRPPRGIMRLALLGGTPVGCGTVHSLAPGDAEIKRVYVAPKPGAAAWAGR